MAIRSIATIRPTVDRIGIAVKNRHLGKCGYGQWTLNYWGQNQTFSVNFPFSVALQV